MKKMLRPLLYGALAALVLIQFFPAEKNQSAASPAPLAAAYEIPDPVMALLKPACYDCHSNHTRYPWYNNLQPVGWWMASHVNDGKRHLNFDEFTNRPIAVQNHKFEEIAEVVGEEKEMPEFSYTWTHADARLSDEQRAVITSWAQAQMERLKERYPADSLVMRRRGQPAPEAPREVQEEQHEAGHDPD